MRLETFDLGLVDFKQALDFQKEIFLKVKNREIPSSVIFCRHNPVITLNRNTDRHNILADESELNANKIKIFEIERGGSVTYHGPGQLIAYPVFDLNDFKKDIHWFLRLLEEIIIELLSKLGVKGERVPPLTGVWVDKKKIASIGIAIRRWITFHGLSINVKKDDLDNFRLIRPCGMDVEMTSLESVLGRNIDIEEIKQGLILKFRAKGVEKWLK